jgi:hypothetical protein
MWQYTILLLVGDVPVGDTRRLKSEADELATTRNLAGVIE